MAEYLVIYKHLLISFQLKNISEFIFNDVCLLKEEPILLLKQEFRELTIYNSIIEAIATGASKFNEISTKIKEETSKCASYMKNLQEVRIIDKIIPYGENYNSKRSIYMFYLISFLDFGINMFFLMLLLYL